MGFFVILDIEPTTDLDIIKKAYRTKLRITNPETNPEEFMKLRRAYEDAVIYAENHVENKEAYDEYDDEYYDEEYYGEQEGPDEETYDLDEHAQQMYDWVGRVDKLYSDYSKRNMVEEWIKVLEDDIPFRIEYYQICRSYIFNRFFRAGYSLYLPREVRLYIDEFFDFSETPLMRAKRRRYVLARTLNKKVKLCEKIEFDKLINDETEVSKIDYFYARYEQLIDELPEYEFNENYDGDIEKQLAFLKEMEVCYLPFECIYTAFYFYKYSENEVNERIIALTDRFGNGVEIGLLQAEYYIYKGQQDAAKELLATLYKEAPLKNYVAIYQMAVCCLKVNMLYESYMLVKQLTWLNPKPFMNDMADMICEKIESAYQDKLGRDVEITDIEHIHMCRMYLRSGREEDAVLVLKHVKNPKENLWEYEIAHMICVMYEEAKFVKPFRNFVEYPPYDPIMPMEVKGVEEILKVLNSYPEEKCTPLDRLELKELKARYLFEQWRFDECEAMCNEMLEEYPLSYSILMLRGYGDYCKNSKGYHNKSKNYIDFDFLINTMPKRIEARLVCCLLMAFIKSTKRPLEVLEPVKEKLEDHYEYFEALKYLFSSDDNDIKYYLEGVAKILKKSKECQLTIPAVSKYKLLDLHNIFLEFCENTWVIKKDSGEEKACFEFLKSLSSSEYNHPELYFEWYDYYVCNYEYENAIETLKSFLKKETLPSKVSRICRRMVLVYSRMHDVENAEKYMTMVADDERCCVYKTISSMYYDLGDYEKTIYYLKLIIEDVSATIYEYWKLGQSYKMLGQYEEAVQAFYDGIRTCSITGDYGLKSNLYEAIYLVYENTEEWDKALAVLDEMRAKTRSDYIKYTRYHYFKGFVYWRQDVDNNNADIIIENWNKAIEGGLVIPFFYKRFADVYEQQGQTDKQLETLLTGIEICGANCDYGDYDNLYVDLFWLYFQNREYEKGANIAKQIAEHTAIETLKKESLQRVALSSMFAEDYDTAYEYYVKAKEAKIYPKDVMDSGQPDIDLFLCCYFMGRYEEAYTLAKSLAFGYGEQRGSFMTTAIRSYFMAYGRFDEELVRRAIQHKLASLEADDEEEKAMTYCALAELYFILSDHEKVEEYKRKAYEGFRNIESEYEYYLIIMESWILGYQGRFTEAFEMYLRHEDAKSIETGNSDYAEYRFFRQKKH